MKSYSIIPFLLYFSTFCMTKAQNCETRYGNRGIISYTRPYYSDGQKCWVIEVPDGNYVRIDIKEMALNGRECSSEHLDITVVNSNEVYQFCPRDKITKPIIALNDVNITYYYSYWGYTTPYWRTTGWYTPYDQATFRLNYKIESLICAQKKSFRCSEEECVYEYQVCDGVKNCKNGADEKSCGTGVKAIKGVNETRNIALKWLKNHQLPSYGWGRNTHRAITALFLSGGTTFQEESLEEDLMIKQLEIQIAVALLRNSSKILSVNDLSMYINALLITCHNPRQFYGQDLLHILNERLVQSKSPSPGAYLTLCTGNWVFTDYHIKTLLSYLDQPSGQPFDIDIEAMTTLALTCVKNRSNVFQDLQNAIQAYNDVINKFMASQRYDGSFGNIYTSSLITQALLSSGQESNKAWNLTSAVQFLMRRQNSSPNFLSTYLAVPIFNGKTLLDMSVECNASRKQGKDEVISEIIETFSGKMKIKYSLYIDDQIYISHSLYLRMAENSSAYDVMKVAQVADPKYKFLHTDTSGHIYVYEIADITNDLEAGKFWQLYIGYSGIKGRLEHSTESLDKLILREGQHLVMWYRAINSKEN